METDKEQPWPILYEIWIEFLRVFNGNWQGAPLTFFVSHLTRNPYGFSINEKTSIIPKFVKIFEDLDLEVVEPFSSSTEKIKNNKNWAYKIAQSNYKDLKRCDSIFAILNGNPPDEGIMIELGMAIALNKKIFLFRDDFRNCTDNNQYPLNLMIFLGLPEKSWRDYYYESIEDITNETKKFIKWAKNH